MDVDVHRQAIASAGTPYLKLNIKKKRHPTTRIQKPASGQNNGTKNGKILPVCNACWTVLIALIFIMFGMNKIFNYGSTAGWMDAMGAPSFLLPGVVVLEVLGGLAIVVGWQTRWVALALAGFSILSAIIFHNNFSDQNEMANFMKNIAISGGFLFLFANGAGRWSLDNLKQV